MNVKKSTLDKFIIPYLVPYLVPGLVALFLAVVGVIMVSQDDFARAENMFERGEYVSAFQIYEDLANDGDARAQFALFYIYQQGLGQNIYDPDKAFDWLVASVGRGYAWAEMRLGDAYYSGDEWVERDLTMAERLWAQAASTGLQPAIDKLMALYPLDGLSGAPQLTSWNDTFFRLELNIEDGAPWAMALLGVLMLDGPEDMRDEQAAHDYLLAAAEHGNGMAMIRLGWPDIPPPPRSTAAARGMR